MKELVIISGKGGTGKTSITASFAALAGNAVLADCDVDAADLHLLLKPEIKNQHEFICGREAIINQELCTNCGLCSSLCRFEAIKISDGKVMIDPYSCEGCGVCVHFCLAQAIEFPERLCGEWYESDTRYGKMIHAKLAPAAENSGKLVAQVRQAARESAEKQSGKLILVDGPPGIGCPVIASITGATAILVISEPTVSGEHDLERVLKLAKHFGVPAMVCVNKWDINPEAAERIEQKAVACGAKAVGRIPYDETFTQSQIRGQLVVDFPDSIAAQDISKLWNKISQMI
jgi:MinD superfamily P-loop ATPase